MIARITRILLIFQVLIGIGIFMLMTRVLHVSGVALALLSSAALLLLLRLLITGNNFYLAWRYRSETPQHYRIDGWQACTLFLSEFKATMTASSWAMPFHRFSKRVAAYPQELPVLLVHGYGCNSGYWHAMSKALLRANITHYAVDLEPVIGGIDEYVPLIHAAVERLCRETGQDKVVIVAHSMGGLASRAYLRDHGSHRIAKVITLGTPHHGTALAQFGVGLNTHQMRWTATEQEGLASAWLRKLAASENPTVYRLFVSMYSHQDNIISPQNSSCLPEAKNIEFNGIGHVALAYSTKIQAEVIREIREASRPRLVATA
jgi:triacylglycerol lipase